MSVCGGGVSARAAAATTRAHVWRHFGLELLELVLLGDNVVDLFRQLLVRRLRRQRTAATRSKRRCGRAADAHRLAAFERSFDLHADSTPSETRCAGAAQTRAQRQPTFFKSTRSRKSVDSAHAVVTIDCRRAERSEITGSGERKRHLFAFVLHGKRQRQAVVDFDDVLVRCLEKFSLRVSRASVNNGKNRRQTHSDSEREIAQSS